VEVRILDPVAAREPLELARPFERAPARGAAILACLALAVLAGGVLLGRALAPPHHVPIRHAVHRPHVVRLDQILRALQATRTSARQLLAGAASAPAQASAAQSLARAYDSAAGAAAALATPTSREKNLTRLLARTAATYRLLERAAAHGDARSFGRAAAEAEFDEQSIDRRLAALAG
jgi:hypothetical protein